MERRVPGDLGWRLDDGDRRPPDDVDGDHRPPHDAGGFLRILSVTPFLVLGVVAVIALFSWALLFVFGFGEQETLWKWASGRPAGEVFTGLVVVLGLGLACAAVLVLAIWAALYGFREDASAGFWLVWQGLALAALCALVIVETLAAARAAAGLRTTEVVLIAAALAGSIALFHLRRRRGPPPPRDAGEDAG